MGYGDEKPYGFDGIAMESSFACVSVLEELEEETQTNHEKALLENLAATLGVVTSIVLLTRMKVFNLDPY